MKRSFRMLRGPVLLGIAVAAIADLDRVFPGPDFFRDISDEKE